MVGVVISLCSGYVADTHSVDAKGIFSPIESNHAEIASDFLTHTAHAEREVTAGSHTATSSTKIPVTGFAFLVKGSAEMLVSTFATNQYYLQNLFVRVSHTDLIFPFHYFW